MDYLSRIGKRKLISVVEHLFVYGFCFDGISHYFGFFARTFHLFSLVRSADLITGNSESFKFYVILRLQIGAVRIKCY